MLSTSPLMCMLAALPEWHYTSWNKKWAVLSDGTWECCMYTFLTCFFLSLWSYSKHLSMGKTRGSVILCVCVCMCVCVHLQKQAAPRPSSLHLQCLQYTCQKLTDLHLLAVPFVIWQCLSNLSTGFPKKQYLPTSFTPVTATEQQPRQTKAAITAFLSASLVNSITN